jgi:hypothetical protein
MLEESDEMVGAGRPNWVVGLAMASQIACFILIQLKSLILAYLRARGTRQP